MKWLLLVLVSISSLQAATVNEGPGGQVGGNGGCPTCQNFFNHGLETVAFLLDHEEEVLKKVPILGQQDLHDGYRRVAVDWKILPASNDFLKGRTALTYQETFTTYINTSTYEGLREFEKSQLQVHEFLVLVGAEFDGIYTYSNRLKSLFPDYSKLKSNTSSYQCFEDYCLINKPYYNTAFDELRAEYRRVFFHKDSDLNAVCSFFNFKKGGEVKTLFATSNARIVMDKDQAAKEVGFYSIYAKKVIDVLKCSR